MPTKLIHQVRAVKNIKEIENIIQAQRISEQVLSETLKILKTGITEIEVETFIKKSFVKYKAPILAFEPIVSFGKNSANIHHTPTKNKLKKGDTIMFDFGTTVNHYCSDMSRTYFWGKPTQKQRDIYLIVLQSQELVINKIKAGERRAGVLDQVARGFLKRKFKIGENKKKTDGFIHGLGHGVGVVIHEWPNLKPKSTDMLPTGSVITVEPGLYFKGLCGVRIEDMILITKNGGENLTKVAKELNNIILN